MMHSLSAPATQADANTSPEKGALSPLTTHTSLRQRQRGATAMEYLVAASFVLVVLILAIQHLGEVTRSLFSNSANATTNLGQPAP